MFICKLIRDYFVYKQLSFLAPAPVGKWLTYCTYSNLTYLASYTCFFLNCVDAQARMAKNVNVEEETQEGGERERKRERERKA